MALNASLKLELGGSSLSRGEWGGVPSFRGSLWVVGFDQIKKNMATDGKIFPLHLMRTAPSLHSLI